MAGANSKSWLEKAEIISRIVFGGVIAAFVSVVGLELNASKLGLDKANICSTTFTTIIDRSKHEESSVIAWRISLYESQCDEMPEEIKKLIFSTAAVAEESIATDPAVLAGNLAEGFVAVGRLGTDRYADQNFDILGAAGLPVPGAVLRARWQVNLRTNLNNTESGNNPVVRTIQPGECVRVKEEGKEIRGQTWAKVVYPVTCEP